MIFLVRYLLKRSICVLEIYRNLSEGQEIARRSKLENLVPLLQFWLKFYFKWLISLHGKFLIHLYILFCLSGDKSRDIAKSKIFRWLFWTRSKNYSKLYNICTSFESTSSDNFKNIIFVEIGYSNRKLAYLRNFRGQNDQFRFQKSNMVMWHIKLKLEARRTFCNHFCQKIDLIVSVILEKHFFQKFYRWRHDSPEQPMCLQKLRPGHKMTICPVFIEFHYGLGILKNNRRQDCPKKRRLSITNWYRVNKSTPWISISLHQFKYMLLCFHKTFTTWRHHFQSFCHLVV